MREMILDDERVRRSGVPAMSDVFMQGWSEGFDEGRAVGKTEVGIVLADLIAELRDRADECGAADGWRLPGAVMRLYADRAESRLREVTGDE